MAVMIVMAVRLVALLSTVPMAVVSQWLNHGYEWEHNDLNCFDQACHWQCNSWSNESKNTSWCHVFYRGLRRNNFYSPWIENTGRLGRLGRLHFTYKGNLELFSLVNNKWIKIWSDTRDTASKVEAVLLPEASAQLRFESATWGAVGPITVERRRFRNLKTAVSASLWSQVHFTHGPSTRKWHTAVLDAGKMWIFAGDDGELKNDLWYYDTVTMDGWVDVSESGLWPSPRFSHMAAMQGRYMWVFGGVVQSGLSKELWNYNMDNGNWSLWSLPGPTARESMTLVDLENRLWMFGGYDGSIRNDLWYLTTGSDPFWTLITSSGPSGRYSHDAFQSAGKLWIFGGLTQEGLKNDLWYFDISSNTWSQILEGNENCPSARESATAVVFKGSMWLFGGIDAKNQSDEVWKLDLLDLQSENAKSDAWRLLDSGTGPNGRRFHVSVLDEEGRMWCHNGELWYFETRTSTTTTTQSSTRTSTSQTTTETTSTSTSSTSSTSSSSSTTGTTTITSTSTTISSTTSTSSSSTTSTTKSTTSSSTSRTSTTSSTSSSSSSSTSSTTSISTTTSQTSTSSSSTSTTSTSSTSGTTTTTSSSSTSRTTTTSSSTSSSTSKTTTTSSTSRTSTSSTTISQTSTTSLTSTTSNTSTTTTETTTSSSTSTETTTSSSITWTSTTSSFTETTLTFWNTITSSTTTQVKDLNLLLHEFLKTQVEETLMNLTTSNASTVTVEIKSPDVDFHLSLVTFSNPGNDTKNHTTHPTDPTLVNESSTLLAVPSFTSPVASPLLASMSLSTLHLPGIDLPEIDAPVESANGKVGVVAGPLIQISLLDTELDSVDLNFSEPLIFRVSEEAVDSASCNFLTEAGWSEEGMHKASSEEVQQAFGPGPVDTSGTWCATTHLSLFTILRPCTFSETLQRESKCFDPPTFGALLGSSILCLCCGACGFYTTVRSRHVIGGKMKLSDVEGSSHDVPFQVKRPQRDNDFHGVLDGKTLVTWEVKPLAGTGSDGIRPVQMSEMATQLTSPKRRLHLNVVTKFFSDRADRSQVQLPRSGTALSSLQSYPELEEGMEGGMEGPHDFHDRTAKSTSSSGPVCEVFEDRQYIEYFSETHQKWIQGSIQGSGHLPTASSDEKIMPTYHVRLSRNQWRRFVPVNSLRLPFQPGDSVSANVDDQWQAATVQKRHGYPLAYEVQLLHTFETHVLSGERVRSRYDKEDTILAFEGATKGWVQCSVESASESTWPQIMVAGLTLQGTDEALPIPHFLIRPSTRMEGFSS